MINRMKDRQRLVTNLKNGSFRAFMALDNLGVHLLPKHYYTPVADYRWLRQNRDLWMKRVSLQGIEWNLDAQLRWLEQICAPYCHEVQGLSFFASASRYGEGFGEIESQVLHCFLRAMRPARVLEIGSGVSTACMVHAIELGDGATSTTRITCIEPYPKKAFRSIAYIDHIEQFCQETPRAVFDELQAGDLLFIDSSHAVKIGSDVIHLCLNVLPNLPPDIFVHIHDICLPYVYNRDALENYLGWQETALVLALLTNNAGFEVLACLSGLHYDRPCELATILPDYRPQANEEGLRPSATAPGHFPSSLWLRTTGKLTGLREASSD